MSADQEVRPTPRVLVACSGAGHVFRGYETISQELAHALRDVVHVTLARGGGPLVGADAVRLPCLQRFGWTARRLGMSGSNAYLIEQRSFAPGVYALARLGGFDIVHLHDPGLMNAIWHARRVMGGRFAIVFTNGGAMSPEHLVRPDLIQSVTPVDAEQLRLAGFADWRVAMVPHGTRAVEPPPRAFALQSALRIIGVGSLNDGVKGFATAIRAVAALPAATLRLVGQRDEETSTLERLGRDLLGARFTTDTLPRDTVQAALAAADVFVLPTRGEGFGLAVVEAMAAGLPCVVSDVPVLRWMVGDAAVLVPPGQPDAWTAAIASLTEDRRRELSARARQRAAAFTWENLADQHVAMYRKAILARERGGTIGHPSRRGDIR